MNVPRAQRRRALKLARIMHGIDHFTALSGAACSIWNGASLRVAIQFAAGFCALNPKTTVPPVDLLALKQRFV
ncbi:MAG TPA: hypothetical protein VKX17_22210 [Planctomycetota bacterium]|nr:hypothetical protein [Planctomycetota bacterium]